MTFQELLASTKPVITRKEAASALGCDPRLISRGIKENKIKAFPLGRKILIPREPFIVLFLGEDWRKNLGL
jgi:excisionase family DNA binding protein